MANYTLNHHNETVFALLQLLLQKEKNKQTDEKKLTILSGIIDVLCIEITQELNT